MTEAILATITDAAMALAVSERTVRYLIARGELAPVIHIGRSVRIPVETLRAFVDARASETRVERGA